MEDIRFKEICTGISDRRVVLDPCSEFSLLCSSRGLSSAAASDLFYDILGMSGEEVIAVLSGNV